MADGVLYKTFDNPARAWARVLPSTQDYLVTIMAPVDTRYTLEVIVTSPYEPPTLTPTRIPPTPTRIPPTPTRVPTPEWITFAPGTDTAVRSGALAPGQDKQYIFRALAGQNGRILLGSTPAGAANFALVGVSDGIVYKSMNDPQREWSFTFPRTQDYLIALRAPTPANYTLELTISPLPTPPPVPERIVFEPGSYSAVRSGPLYANTVKQYIFNARAGQTARILFASPSPAANFAVQGVNDGVIYKALANSAREWSFVLPSTQDYLISILAPVNTSYQLELTITPTSAPTPTPTPTPERISFATGEDSAVRSGTVQAGQQRQYVFRALAGQTATIRLDVPPGSSANFAVSGVTDGVVYKAASDPLREWSATLPLTQDYLITIFSTTTTNYQLELIIPPAPTATATATATATTAAPTPTKTSVPPTATPTKTPVPPTATPTNTPVPPTATPTNTSVPPTPTNTPVPPSHTHQHACTADRHPHQHRRAADTHQHARAADTNRHTRTAHRHADGNASPVHGYAGSHGHAVSLSVRRFDTK